jgi:hypothetical protein
MNTLHVLRKPQVEPDAAAMSSPGLTPGASPENGREPMIDMHGIIKTLRTRREK